MDQGILLNTLRDSYHKPTALKGNFCTLGDSNMLKAVTAQARAIDRIFEFLIVGAKPRHSGQAAGAKQESPCNLCPSRCIAEAHVTLPLFIEGGEFPGL